MATPTATHLKDYTAPDYHIEHTDLTITLLKPAANVKTHMSFTRTHGVGAHAPLTLNGEHITLLNVAVDGKSLSEQDYTLTDKTLSITCPLPEAFTLSIENKVIDPIKNTSLSGVYESNGVVCTQCEAQGFRKITYYLDRPDVMSLFTTTLLADKTDYPVLLSNGNKIKSGDLTDNQHFATWEDPIKKPCYLFAMVAGDLKVRADTFVTCSGKTVDCEIWVREHELPFCGHAMLALKQAMKWDEDTFGREYDLDIYMIVAVSDFNAGAMENKGLNIFNSRFIMADPSTATDHDYELIQAVVAHEYFHNWTGNRITCRDWFQLSLKEGLTVFRDEEFTSDHNSRAIKRIQDAQFMRTGQFAEDASPMSHPVRPESYIEMNNFYTATVYQKGAEVIRMMHTLLGKDGFRAGMDLYFERHDGQAVTCDDFAAAMADAAGRDLTQFKRWYSQAGTPTLRVTDEYEPGTKRYTLQVSQHAPKNHADNQPYHLPVNMGLLGPDGEALEATYHGHNGSHFILDLTEAKQSFVFENVSAHPIPSLLRDFSAPVKLEYNFTQAQLITLLGHDEDTYCRWQAAQALGMRLIRAHMANPEAFNVPLAYLDAMSNTLNDTRLDKALIANLLGVPSVNEVIESMDVADVDGAQAARKAVLAALSRHLLDGLISTYKALELKTYHWNPEDNAKRSLKNACLGLLMYTDSPEVTALAQTQFTSANNMTDQFAALAALASGHDRDAAAAALEAFYTQWQDNELVVNKWLGLQAAQTRGDTLATVKALTEHKAFDYTNPNNVYSLIRTFGSNLVHLHRADGASYTFMRDQIAKLNDINPQVGSAMARTLMRWRQFDPARQAKIKACLESLLELKLSQNVYEIVSKSL
jgi:aminopeptidase N